MSVKIYVEGGGVGERSIKNCREGFRRFFERLLQGKGRVKVVACGGREDTFKAFKLAHENRKPDHYAILLVDSEGPVETHGSPWDYLKAMDKWEKPETSEDDQAHLMVQCMEAWFMADREAVVEYFDEGVKIAHLPASDNEDIEGISKEKIAAALGKAARKVRKARGTEKQGYDKVQDGFSLLALINPDKVCKASKHAHRLRETLKRKLPDRP